jgi:DNA-binding transcriptional regulator GbsR (MarR family)
MSSEAIHSESEDPSTRAVPRHGHSQPLGSTDPQWELIQLCVRVTQVLGMPRSVGEIFGFIFTSALPVTFDEIVGGLGVSNGSASHGLRYLRRLGAIQVSYHARDRRDFYQAETSLRNMANGFLAENILFYMRGVDERLRVLHERTSQSDSPGSKSLAERIGLLQEWNHQASSAISAALDTLP